MRSRSWRPHLALNAILLLAVLAPVSTPPTIAATQTLSVDGSDPTASNTSCSPSCKTIQGALNLAGPGASITIAPGTYTETLTITQSVSITGGVPLRPGEQGPTIVDAGGTGSVVTIPNVVPPNVLVSFTSLTLIDGVAPAGSAPNANAVGGGIAALGGTVSLSDTAVLSNTATDRGGGIYASNALTLTQSPVVSNTAGGLNGYGYGGGIYANNAVALTGSPVISNTATGVNGNGYGGGIYANDAVTLTDSPVIINTAGYSIGGSGGGIYANDAVTLTGSPVISNTAGYSGGGIAAYGAVTLTNSQVSANTATYGGGGLAELGNGATVPNSIVLSNSAVLGNTASSGDGGGIVTSGSLSLTNSTLSANSAATYGGAVASNGGPVASTGSLTASFSTISTNSALKGGGIAMVRSGVWGQVGTTTLKATILAGNTAPSGPDADCEGPVISLGDNLIGDTDGCSGFSAPGDLTGSGAHPLDPRLDVLADNGGPTLTQALLPGSPAINHVPAARCTDASGTPVTSDQSGVARPDPGDLSGACDSGAYEYDGGPVILGVVPNSGPLAGGTQVVIRGTDLEGTGPLSVTFGGIAATNIITDPSGQLITATTPAHAAGTVDVAVAALVGTSVITTPVTPADQFTYGVPSTPTSTSRPASTPTSTPTVAPTRTPTATSAAPSLPRLALVPTSAHVGDRVNISGSGFSPNELVMLALNGEALATTTIRTSGQGSFTATVTAPDSLLTGANTVSALGAMSGRVALATVLGRRRTQTYYLAGGVESSTEHTALDLLNTSAQRAHVGYTLYSQTGDTTRGTLTVGAHAARVVPIAGLTPLRGSFGLALSADRSIAAQLTLTRKGRDGDAILATAGMARRWYLAAGETARTFHESVAILNPDRTRPAQVRLQLLPSGGGRSRTVTLRVRPHTQLVEDITPLLPGQSPSIIAAANRPVVAERRLTFSRDGHGHDYGLTTRLGTTTPALLWLLAQGTPRPHGQTSLALLNPTPRTAHVTARFYGRSGRLVSSQTIRLNGPGRAEITLPSVGPARGAADVVTSDQPLVVERPEYSRAPNGLRTAGSAVFGRNGVAPRWSFPGGDTRRGQREVLLLANPSVATVHVVVTLYGSDGRTVQQHVTLPPHGQSTLDVGRSFPGATGVHGVRVTSTNGDGFLAEQTVFGASGSTVQRTEGLAQ